MKKLVTCLLLVVSFAVLFACDAPHQHTYGEWVSNEEGHYRPYTCGCEGNEELTAHEVNDDGLCGVCGYDTKELDKTYAMIKSAYADSIKYAVDSVDLDGVRVVNYYGKLDNVHVANVASSYSEYPNNAYIQSVRDMEFRYYLATRVYVFYNGKLYTAKEAYEQEIITFNTLCKIFGIHTSGLDTFSEDDYNKLKACASLKWPTSADKYELKTYYGEYNGYLAVSYNYQGMQADVCFDEYVENLAFGYGYESSRIRLMSETEMYDIGEAFENGVITKEDLYDIFELHVGEKVNEELINMMITPAYELCMKYKDDFAKVPEFGSFHLTVYYGKYGDSYIFGLNSDYFGNLVSATEEEKELMRYGNFSGEYVLNNGKLYTLEQALEAGIITEEIKQDVMIKYYS